MVNFSKFYSEELQHPLTDCHKISHGWLRQRYDPARRQNSYRSSQWGRQGKCVKYHSRVVFSFLFVTPIFSRVPKPNRRTNFYAVWFIGCQSQVLHSWRHKTTKKVSDFPIFTPKTPQKWAWIGIFKLNAKNIKTYILSKLFQRFKPEFAQWQMPLNTLYGWSKQAYNKSKMADGRHLEKSEKGHISATVWLITVKCGTVMYTGPPNRTSR